MYSASSMELGQATRVTTGYFLLIFEIYVAKIVSRQWILELDEGFKRVRP